MTIAISADTSRLTSREDIAESTMAFHLVMPADFSIPGRAVARYHLVESA